MSLNITLTTDRSILSAPVVAGLRHGLDEAGHVVLLVPTFGVALDAQGQRFQSLQEDEGVEGRERRAGVP